MNIILFYNPLNRLQIHNRIKELANGTRLKLKLTNYMPKILKMHKKSVCLYNKKADLYTFMM